VFTGEDGQPFTSRQYLKGLVADQALGIQVLKEVLGRK